MTQPAKQQIRSAAYRPRRGVVLVIVLVVIVVLALAGYTFTNLMLANHQAAELTGRQVQARALAESGVENIRMFLLNDDATQKELGGHYDNPAYFKAIPVVLSDDPRYQGSFSVLAPLVDEYGSLMGIPRYGLEDVSTKLNINSLLFVEETVEGAGRELLMSLPGMTEEIADSILDWMDEDDEPREFGVESEYYTGLIPRYMAKNGPFDTVEEMLLVAGVTPQLLFGLDTNRNGMVDLHEMDEYSTLTAMSEEPLTVDLTQPGLERGWSGFITLYSQERNTDAEGLQRIDLNGDDLEELHGQLTEVFSEEWANFIILYRQNGPSNSNDQGESAAGAELDFEQEGGTKLTQVLDLIGVKTEARVGNDQTVFESPFSSDQAAMALYLPELLDKASVSSNGAIPGRINVNQCSATVLAGIPGMDEELAGQILDNRGPALDPENEDIAFQSEAWLLTSGLVSLDKMKELMPFVTAGGHVYRAEIVGFFADGAAYSRHEVIIDATGEAPRIVFWRDVSHLGRGYPMELLTDQVLVAPQ